MNVFKFSRSFLCQKRWSASIVPLNRSRQFSVDSPNQLVSVIEEEKLPVATLLMQRPPVNSLNLELLQQITAAIKDLEKRKFEGFVLSSKSPTVFSAGLDIMEMYNPTEKRFREYWKSLQEMWKTLYLTPLITMAAINGHAPAGGCMMSLSCDYRVMVESNAVIGLNETMLGIVAPEWFRDLLITNIGFRQAEKSLYLGTLHSPQQALSLNMVDELASNAEDLHSKIKKQMSIWLKIPGVARKMTKLGLRKPFVQKLETYEQQELEEVARFVQSETVQKSLGKYLESLKAKKG